MGEKKVEMHVHVLGIERQKPIHNINVLCCLKE
jgi:hypothetical protein